MRSLPENPRSGLVHIFGFEAVFTIYLFNVRHLLEHALNLLRIIGIRRIDLFAKHRGYFNGAQGAVF